MKAYIKELSVLVIFLAILGAVLYGRHSESSKFIAPVEYMAKLPGSVRFTVAGDYGATLHTRAALNQIKAAQPDYAIAVGDFSYSQTGNEREWCTFMTSGIGKIPFELISGNHESLEGHDGSIEYFKQCLPDKLSLGDGDYAKQYYFDYPQPGTGDASAAGSLTPLVRTILITPNLTFEKGSKPNDYNSPSSPRYAWLQERIEEARIAGIPWIIVAMHETCFTASAKKCQIGLGLMNLLIDEKVDLILQGHAHSYERTHQLICADPNNPECMIISPQSTYAKGGGPIQVITGTGGVKLAKITEGSVWNPFFAALSGANRNPSFGVSIVDVDQKSLRLHFQPVGKGTFSDSFSIVKGE